jgi:ribosome maturation factor RimP
MGDELQQAVAPVVESLGLELVDLELRPGLLRVVVDREGGVDLESVSEATRQLSGLLDRHDLMPGSRYTLEVSSPGLERPLRTPEQFGRAVGEQVMVRTQPDSGLERRVQGILVAADDQALTVSAEGLPEGGLRIAYTDVERARTVFEWGPAERPRTQNPRTQNARTQKQTTRSTDSSAKSRPTSKKAVAS